MATAKPGAALQHRMEKWTEDMVMIMH